MRQARNMNPTQWIVCVIQLTFPFLIMAQTYSPRDYPATELSNGVLRAKVYLPDAEKGFYRGTRFDWAGVMGSLELQGAQLRWARSSRSSIRRWKTLRLAIPLRQGSTARRAGRLRNSLEAMARRSDMSRRNRAKPSARLASDLCARSTTRRTALTPTIQL